MLKIVTVPNKILTTPTKSITKIDEKIKKLVSDMKKTLDKQVDPEGVGLAAPQVGVNLALFIMKPTTKSLVKVFINPRIIKSEIRNPKSETNLKSKIQKKSKQKKALEGCLSVPRIWSPIKRAGRVLLEYQILTGAVRKEWFQGFEAMIVQHEVDHLNGILFTQRALEQKNQLYEEKKGKLVKLEY